MATETITSVVAPLDNGACEESVGEIVVLEGTELVVDAAVLGGIQEVVQFFVTVSCLRLLKYTINLQIPVSHQQSIR